MKDLIKKIWSILWSDTFWGPIEQILQGDTHTMDTPLPQPTPPNPDVLVAWDSQQHNYHNVRVLCDLAGLTVDEKNLICACIYQESQFFNSAVNRNKRNGVVVSTDWGICQINDYYHVAPTGTPFSSVQEVLDHPEKTVNFMISMYQNGALKQWVSYSSGAYKQWLEPSSPMWKLAQ